MGYFGGDLGGWQLEEELGDLASFEDEDLRDGRIFAESRAYQFGGNVDDEGVVDAD
jgi:hypothetical protein